MFRDSQGPWIEAAEAYVDRGDDSAIRRLLTEHRDRLDAEARRSDDRAEAIVEVRAEYERLRTLARPLTPPRAEPIPRGLSYEEQRRWVVGRVRVGIAGYLPAEWRCHEPMCSLVARWEHPGEAGVSPGSVRDVLSDRRFCTRHSKRKHVGQALAAKDPRGLVTTYRSSPGRDVMAAVTGGADE